MSFDTLLLAGESQTVEFKTSFDKTTVESLVAFANAQGGTILVGVSDAGLINGISLGKETLNEWLGQIKSATSPSLIPDMAAEHINGKTVVVIRPGEFPVKPVSTRGRYFKRLASSNRQPGLAEIADPRMHRIVSPLRKPPALHSPLSIKNSGHSKTFRSRPRKVKPSASSGAMVKSQSLNRDCLV